MEALTSLVGFTRAEDGLCVGYVCVAGMVSLPAISLCVLCNTGSTVGKFLQEDV